MNALAYAMNCSYISRTTRCGVTLTRFPVWSAALRIALLTATYIERWSAVQAVAGTEESRLGHPALVSAAVNALAMRLNAAQVGSSMMIPSGPLSFALANSEPLPFVGVGDPPPESLPTTDTVITTVTAITASRAIPPKIHLPLPPRRCGGPGGGPHGCGGPQCGAPPGWPPVGGCEPH